jgi:putative transposase
MPQSLSNILIHLVFSTQDRLPLLTSEVRSELHPYMAGTLRNIQCPALQVGGVEDHVHVLFRLPRTMTVAEVVEKVKGSSSKWIKTKSAACANFAWQAGYGAFSTGSQEVEGMSRYIREQKEHHRTVSFKEEYMAILRASGVEWDEKYIWD